MWLPIYPAQKSNVWVALALDIWPKSDETQPGAIRARKRRREAGQFAQSPGVVRYVDVSNFRGKIALHYNRAQMPQHRVSDTELPDLETGHTSPHRGQHRGSQSYAVVSEADEEALEEKAPARACCQLSNFQTSRVCLIWCKGSLMITAW